MKNLDSVISQFVQKFSPQISKTFRGGAEFSTKVDGAQFDVARGPSSFKTPPLALSAQIYAAGVKQCRSFQDVFFLSGAWRGLLQLCLYCL